MATTSKRARVERAAERFGIAGAPPLDVQPRHVRAVPLAHLRQAIAEVSGDDDERARAFSNQVRDDGLHPGRAGSGHRERQTSPRRARNSPRQPSAHIVQEREHDRVEMADRGRRHRPHHARRRHARARAEQDAIGFRQQAHTVTSWNVSIASLNAATPASGSGTSGGRGRPTSQPTSLERGLQPGDAVDVSEQARQRQDLALKIARLVVTALPEQLQQPNARIGDDVGQRQDPARRADGQRGVEAWSSTRRAP